MPREPPAAGDARLNYISDSRRWRVIRD